MFSVDMVYIENSNICITAPRTFPTKCLDKFNLSFPYPALVRHTAIFIPVLSLAIRVTKLCTRWLSTLGAVSRISPSCGVITSHAAILYASLAAVGFAERNIKFLMTMLASKCNSVFSHNSIIPQYSIYFAIAQRRIAAAQMQERLPGV